MNINWYSVPHFYTLLQQWTNCTHYINIPLYPYFISSYSSLFGCLYYLDVGIPQLLAESHSVLQKVLLCRCYKNLHLCCSHLGLVIGKACFQYWEHTFHTNAHSNTGHVLVLWVKHSHQVVITPTTCNAANSSTFSLAVT